MLKRNIKLYHFALLVSFINLVLYHLPVYRFIYDNIDLTTSHGSLLFISLTILVVVLNAFVFYIGLYLLRFIGKIILVIFFNLSAVAVYFVNTYGVIIDRTMMSNVFNTKFEEASSFFSLTLISYLIFLGILPSILLFKPKVINVKLKQFLIHILLTLVFLLSLAYANAPNWLWIDKHAKVLGALVMPWSYVVNTCRFYYQESEKNKEQILLPDITSKNTEKSIAVLVIGEAARSQNFSLYGYEKNTNPLLAKMDNVHHYKAQACATYTTGGVKCILEHKNTSELFEILPNYLFRNGVEVIWRTENWGEPTVKVEKFLRRDKLEKLCQAGDRCGYDEILLVGLKEQILASKEAKILVVLHTTTSHGPTYYKKYPQQFEVFKPVCKSVELAKCSQTELLNAYDNTIVYTDYILATLIEDLKQLKEYKTSMIYVSDHGESLGENNLYMHGVPASIAPKVQLDIPFIVWTSDSTRKLKDKKNLSQHNVFHSILDFLEIESPVYDKNMSIFETISENNQ